MKVLQLSLVLLCLSATTAMATTLDDLVRDGRLQARSWLDPATDIVPGQQVKLVLEFATDRWFAGGTRIRIPEVPGLIILQTESFASNSSETRNGQSWVIQRWALEVYPQREGDFEIPPIRASLKVNSDGTSAVEGEMLSPALQFRATTPDALGRAEHWVAAPQYSVSQSFDRDLDNLKVRIGQPVRCVDIAHQCRHSRVRLRRTDDLQPVACLLDRIEVDAGRHGVGPAPAGGAGCQYRGLATHFYRLVVALAAVAGPAPGGSPHGRLRLPL